MSEGPELEATQYQRDGGPSHVGRNVLERVDLHDTDEENVRVVPKGGPLQNLQEDSRNRSVSTKYPNVRLPGLILDPMVCTYRGLIKKNLRDEAPPLCHVQHIVEEVV